MNRSFNKKINEDRIIIDLRIQAEDLINNMELMTSETYLLEAKRIEKLIEERIEKLMKDLNK